MAGQVRCRQHAGAARARRQSPPEGEETLDPKPTRDVVPDYLTWQVVVNGGDSILEALDLEARYQVSFRDALIIQATQAAGAALLYSEDLPEGQAHGSVRVINPFNLGDVKA